MKARTKIIIKKTTIAILITILVLSTILISTLALYLYAGNDDDKTADHIFAFL